MFTKSLRLTLATAALAALGAPAASLRAQQGDGPIGAGGSARARALREAQLEAKIERLRRDLESLARREVDARRGRSGALPDSSLSEIQPQIERALIALRQAEATLAIQRATAAAAVREALRERVVQVPRPAPAPEAEPRGWIGVNLSSAAKVSSSAGKVFVYNYDYPVVESVEPGSPARRAGLRAGDTILAYDGRDVRERAVPVASQLRPGRRLVVRVRRDGEVKDVPVAVERRPTSFSRYYVVQTPEAPLPPEPPAALAPLPPMPAAPPISTDFRETRTPRARRRVAEATAEAVVAGIMAPVAPPPPGTTPPTPPTIFLGNGWGSTVAGAQLVAVTTQELRDVFGVSSGVLVVNVAEGSPAASSGLRSGDVILRANDAAIATPRALQSVVRQCTTRSARLDVVRKKKGREVTLRW